MASGSTYIVERNDAGGYEPMIHQGVPVGEIHEVRAGALADRTLDAGLWRSGPATYNYDFVTDETFVVLEGAATVELVATRESVELRAGDVAYFVAGTRSIWTIPQTFKKFVVVLPT